MVRHSKHEAGPVQEFSASVVAAVRGGTLASDTIARQRVMNSIPISVLVVILIVALALWLIRSRGSFPR